MYIIIDKLGKMVGSGNTSLNMEGADTIEINDTKIIMMLEKGCFFKNGEVVETKEYKEIILREQIEQINADFDAKISEYLAKYPKREQDTFSEKKREAEKVLAGGESLYISEKAKVLGVTPEQFAQVIIAKNNEWAAKYVALENEKDIQIAQIEQQLKNL